MDVLKQPMCAWAVYMDAQRKGASSLPLWCTLWHILALKGCDNITSSTKYSDKLWKEQ